MSHQDHEKNKRLHQTINSLPTEPTTQHKIELKPLKELARRWREVNYQHPAKNTFRVCADELESLIPALEAAFAELNQSVRFYRQAADTAEAEIAALKSHGEQTDVQLAGCLTAAEGWAKEPPKQGDYGWSLAFQKVLELRQEYEALKEPMACRHPGACMSISAEPPEYWKEPRCRACEQLRLERVAVVSWADRHFKQFWLALCDLEPSVRYLTPTADRLAAELRGGISTEDRSFAEAHDAEVKLREAREIHAIVPHHPYTSGQDCLLCKRIIELRGST